jgi:hypothetical protein
MQQALRNAQDGISVVRPADGAELTRGSSGESMDRAVMHSQRVGAAPSRGRS